MMDALGTDDMSDVDKSACLQNDSILCQQKCSEALAAEANEQPKTKMSDSLSQSSDLTSDFNDKHCPQTSKHQTPHSEEILVSYNNMDEFRDSSMNASIQSITIENPYAKDKNRTQHKGDTVTMDLDSIFEDLMNFDLEGTEDISEDTEEHMSCASSILDEKVQSEKKTPDYDTLSDPADLEGQIPNLQSQDQSEKELYSNNKGLSESLHRYHTHTNLSSTDAATDLTSTTTVTAQMKPTSEPCLGAECISNHGLDNDLVLQLEELEQKKEQLDNQLVQLYSQLVYLDNDDTEPSLLLMDSSVSIGPQSIYVGNKNVFHIAPCETIQSPSVVSESICSEGIPSESINSESSYSVQTNKTGCSVDPGATSNETQDNVTDLRTSESPDRDSTLYDMTTYSMSFDDDSLTDSLEKKPASLADLRHDEVTDLFDKILSETEDMSSPESQAPGVLCPMESNYSCDSSQTDSDPTDSLETDQPKKSHDIRSDAKSRSSEIRSYHIHEPEHKHIEANVAWVYERVYETSQERSLILGDRLEEIPEEAELDLAQVPASAVPAALQRLWTSNSLPDLKSILTEKPTLESTSAYDLTETSGLNLIKQSISSTVGQGQDALNLCTRESNLARTDLYEKELVLLKGDLSISDMQLKHPRFHENILSRSTDLTAVQRRSPKFLQRSKSEDLTQQRSKTYAIRLLSAMTDKVSNSYCITAICFERQKSPSAKSRNCVCIYIRQPLKNVI